MLTRNNIIDFPADWREAMLADLIQVCQQPAEWQAWESDAVACLNTRAACDIIRWHNANAEKWVEIPTSWMPWASSAQEAREGVDWGRVFADVQEF